MGGTGVFIYLWPGWGQGVKKDPWLVNYKYAEITSIIEIGSRGPQAVLEYKDDLEHLTILKQQGWESNPGFCAHQITTLPKEPYPRRLD